MISFTFGANPRPAHRQLPPCQPSDLPERVLKMISFYFTRWESSFMEKAAVYLIVYLQAYQLTFGSKAATCLPPLCHKGWTCFEPFRHRHSTITYLWSFVNLHVTLSIYYFVIFKVYHFLFVFYFYIIYLFSFTYNDVFSVNLIQTWEKFQLKPGHFKIAFVKVQLTTTASR